MQKRYLYLPAAVFFVCFALLIGSVARASAAPVEIRVGGQSPAAGSHMLCAKVSDIIDRYAEGIRSTITTGSGATNPRKVETREMDMAWTGVAFQKAAYEGTGKYKGKACPDIRFLMNIVTVAPGVIFIRADSNIKSILDLKDKRIQVGPKGYFGPRVTTAYLEAYGLTKEVIQNDGGSVSMVGSSDAVQMLQDKKLDAMGATSGLATIEGYMLPLETTVGLKIVRIDEEHLKIAQADLPPNSVSPVTIKGGTYKHEPGDIVLLGSSFTFVINKNIPDDVVYKILSAIYSHLDEIHAVAPTWKGVLLEHGLDSANIPVHPGALKFFKDHGVKEHGG